MVIIKDNSGNSHLTIKSVAKDAVKYSTQGNHIILIKNGIKVQIESLLEEIVSHFKEKNPEGYLCILDCITDRSMIDKLYELAQGKTHCPININYIIIDSLNFIRLNGNIKLDYDIDVKKCFGYNLPQ